MGALEVLCIIIPMFGDNFRGATQSEPHLDCSSVYFVDYLSLWTVSWIRLRVLVYECVWTESVEVTVNFFDV